MNRRLSFLGAVLAAALMAGIAVGDTTDEMPARKSSALFEKMETLVGEWVRVDEEGKVTDELVSIVRSSAGGSVLVETLFPGTDHEMITVYHQDGDAVVLTHYCVLGNQPRMTVRQTTDPNTVSFSCSGGTNMQSEDEPHMHEGSLTWIDENHVQSRWVQHANGEAAHAVEFDLMRRRS